MSNILHDVLLIQEAVASTRLDGETITLNPPQGAPMTDVRSEVVTVTPELARAWLEHNEVNRTLREGRVQQYARAMSAGQWTVTNDDICISPEGDLLNGQHRLNAVLLAGVPVQMGVKFNIPQASMTHMDRGAGRTASDVLRMLGESDTPALAALLRQIWLYKNNLLQTNGARVNDDELIAILERHPEARDSVRAARRYHIDAPLTGVSFSHWLITQVNGAEKADLYFEALATRANEPHGSAIHAVANRLYEARRARAKPVIVEYVYLFLKGWNYWVGGKRSVKMSMQPKNETYLIPIAEWSDSK